MKKNKLVACTIYYQVNKLATANLGTPTLIQVGKKRIAYIVGIDIPPEVSLLDINSMESRPLIEQKALELIEAQLLKDKRKHERDEVILYCCMEEEFNLVVAALGTQAEKEYWDNYQNVNEE